MLFTEGQIVRDGHLYARRRFTSEFVQYRSLVCQRSSGHQKAPLASRHHSLRLPFGCLSEVFEALDCCLASHCLVCDIAECCLHGKGEHRGIKL